MAGGSSPPVGTDRSLSEPPPHRLDTNLSAHALYPHTHVGLEQRVLARMKELGPATGAGVAVGFSGGADSLALAAVLGRVARVVGAPVLLIHVNHALRPESGADAVACQRLADALALPCIVLALPSDLRGRHPGVGIEEAARRERYVALAETARYHGTSLIAVAHHLDDQVETVMLHLLRGAGLKGASAMTELTQLTIPWWECRHSDATTKIDVWRPFLDEPRAVVRSYAQSSGLTPLEDSSNVDPTFRRNRIRHEVMPLLESISPGATGALGRYARIVREEDLLLTELANQAHCRLSLANGTLNAAALRREPLPIQRRVVGCWLEQRSAISDVPLERIDAILFAHRDGETRSFEIGRGWTVVVRGDNIDVQPPENDEPMIVSD